MASYANAEESGAREPLERSLERFLVRVTRGRLPTKTRNALIARLGFGGDDPVTLEAAGAVMGGVSRERVRQVEARLRKVVGIKERIRMPQLRRALQVIELATPLAAEDVPKLLRVLGVTEVGFTAKSLLSVAEFFGVRHRLVLVTIGGRRVLALRIAGLTPKDIRVIFNSATNLARRGIHNVQVLADLLEDNGIRVEPQRLRAIISLNPQIRLRSDGWFWYLGSTEGGRNRAVNVTRKMLAVSSPLSISSLREGMRRLAAWRRRGAVPPVAVLEDFYATRPEFSLDGARMVSSTCRFDPNDYLSEVERTMIAVLRSSPDGIMDRSTFIETCRQRGLNLSTVGVSTTYSPVLERIAHNVWAPRGTIVSPALIEAFQTEHSDRHRTMVSGAWAPDGTYRLAALLTITHVTSGIILLPPGVAFLYGRPFRATTTDGRPCGTINSDHRTSWGWMSFFGRAGAEPSDYLRATFDVLSGVVQLELGGPELMESEHDITEEENMENMVDGDVRRPNSGNLLSRAPGPLHSGAVPDSLFDEGTT